MGDVEPAFRVTTEASGRWKIELVNFQKFEEVLTRNVLNAFCCCFIQSDRLLSAKNCSDASEKLTPSCSVGTSLPWCGSRSGHCANWAWP